MMRCKLSLIELLCVCVFLSQLHGCGPVKTASAKPEAPAKVTNEPKEDALSTVELPEITVKRLGIEVADVEMQSFPRYRTYGGEVMLPTGSTVIVSASCAGMLKSPPNSKLIKAGTSVVDKQPILTLQPLALSPSEKTAVAVALANLATQKADVDGQVAVAQTQVEAASINQRRQERQVKEGTGSAKALDDAKAQLAQAEKTLEAAQARKKTIDQIQIQDETSEDLPPMIVEAPQSGILRLMHHLPGEMVTAGTPLFEVIQADTLWVRVPVYVGETREIAPAKPAEVGDMSSRPGEKRKQAAPIAAPPTATPLASTVDYYYEIANDGMAFWPGQRVSVDLPLNGDADQRAVPWSAVVTDIHGGEWVYEQTGERKYVRRRVQIKNKIGNWAILEQGPAVGAKVVVVGVAEMFGTEFGFGK
jgi:RND family efflux transporter MFP subunit